MNLVRPGGYKKKIPVYLGVYLLLGECVLSFSFILALTFMKAFAKHKLSLVYFCTSI